VSELEVRAGEIVSAVQGSRAKPYKVTVRVRTYSAKEWDRTLVALASQVGHIAALLDGEMPPGVTDELTAARIDLLPVAGEVPPCCSCPDWAEPCKHSAAVCYLVADTLDADPFLLFLMRGQDRDSLLAGLRARRAAGGTQTRRGAARLTLVRSQRRLGGPTPASTPSRRGRVGQPCRPMVPRQSQPSPFHCRSTGGRRCWRWIPRQVRALRQRRSSSWRATRRNGPGSWLTVSGARASSFRKLRISPAVRQRCSLPPPGNGKLSSLPPRPAYQSVTS